ncbi:MAG: hypothetical protein AcusKO_04100 [Acuticoccus sp.]
MKYVAGSLILMVFALAAVPVSAQEAGAVATAPAMAAPDKGDRRDRSSSADERRAARLDMMFGRLANAEDERRARRIARHIMRRMSQSGSDTIDFLMLRAGEAVRKKEYGFALDLLDGVVRLKPEFAEGWNRRATVHFLVGNYGQSIADIEQVLAREPRHWGALAGLSMILVSLERKEEALVVMDQALTVHPHLSRMQERRDRLAQEVGGADI